MKKIIILSLLAIGLTGCHTVNRTPYTGGMGEYGFTYDLDGTPSPFKDTSYRPLTVYDLAAPIIITVTNQPPPRVAYEPAAPEVKYSGATPSSGATVVGATQIYEGSGSGGGNVNGTAGGQLTSGGGGVAPNGVAGGPSVFATSGGDSITNTTSVANNIATNNFPTNNFSNNNFPTNAVPTNAIPFPTNREPTNASNFDQTNQFGRQPTNQIATGGGTNRSSFNQNQVAPNLNPQQAPAINEPAGAPASNQLNQPNQAPQINQQSVLEPNQQTTIAPQQGNAALPPNQGASQQQPAPAAPVAPQANP